MEKAKLANSEKRTGISGPSVWARFILKNSIEKVNISESSFLWRVGKA